LGNCLSIGNTTVCQEKNLRKLDEASCIPRLLKGRHALCDHMRNGQEIVELVDDGTLFLTNFNGTVVEDSGKHHLLGSFIIQYDNETVHIRNMSYSSFSTTHVMAMPAVLSKVTATGYQLSLKYVCRIGKFCISVYPLQRKSNSDINGLGPVPYFEF